MIMGIGTNICGYSNKFIDDEVTKIISKGTMTSLNCQEEDLARELLKIDKWAGKVKFGKIRRRNKYYCIEIS